MSDEARVRVHNGLGGFPFALGDDDGAVAFLQALATRDYNQAAADDRVVSAVPTRPLLVFGRNVSGALRYLMLFDAAAIPVANGTAPIVPPIPVLAGASFSVSVPPFATAAGLVWASSSTDVTLTLAGADFLVGTFHRPI